MKQVLTGNEAAAVAAKLARVKVISAYPITPQTGVIETLAQFVADGELDAEYIKVESEHSALSACIGAAATGVRTFTATCSQGLALMSELLYVAAGMRLPIVMTNANRALSSPINIWCDQQDSISVRDSGWVQLYCENNQEILDTTLQAFRIAEELLLPVMVCYDGFILSHTAEAVDVPQQREVDEFLPPYRIPHQLDPERPVTMGPVGVPESYQEFRFMLQEAVRAAKQKIVDIDRRFWRRFGRRYGLMEQYRSKDADVLLLTMGSLAGSAKGVVDKYRARGEKVGLVRLRCFRPFPEREVIESVGHAKAVAVLEKDVSIGSAGALFLDTAAAFINIIERRPLMLNYVCGLGGRDVTTLDIRRALKEATEAARKKKVEKAIRWLGLREKLVGLKWKG